LAAVLGGAQSIFTCAYDEAFQIPTEESAEIALRTQQIIAYETGVARSVDPLGGSYFVEWLTDETEKQTRLVIEEIDAYGGVEKAIEDGYLQMRIAQRARARKDAIDRGETVVVGQNHFRSDRKEGAIGAVFRVDPQAAARVRAKFAAVLAKRNPLRVKDMLDALRKAASSDTENLMPHLIDCCHAYVTVGEMVATLKGCWGEFQEPVRL
jgi:methylmalonyl-CoA mutase N-terminal domain/subunit